MIFNAIRALILLFINQNWGVQHVQFWNVGLKIKITIRRKMHWKKYCCCCCNGSETRYEGLPSYFSPISDQWHKVPKLSNNQRQNEKPIDGQQLTNIYGQTTKNWYKTMSWPIWTDTNNWQQASEENIWRTPLVLSTSWRSASNHQPSLYPSNIKVTSLSYPHIHPMSMPTNMSLHP